MTTTRHRVASRLALTPRGTGSRPDTDPATNLYPDSKWEKKCWTKEPELDRQDCDDANDALDFQCGDGAEVENNRIFYSIAGSVVAYFCHFRSWTLVEPAICSKDERRQTSRLITDKCGWYQPGSAEYLFPKNLSLETLYFGSTAKTMDTSIIPRDRGITSVGWVLIIVRLSMDSYPYLEVALDDTCLQR
jgi:hypothetical protein